MASIAAVFALQGFNSVGCYGHSFSAFVHASAIFILIPLIPAFVCLLLPNPLGAVSAAILFSPWLLFAYYTDCVRPYEGGGASMIYVAVLFWGLCSSIAGALLGPFLLGKLGIHITDR